MSGSTKIDLHEAAGISIEALFAFSYTHLARIFYGMSDLISCWYKTGQALACPILAFLQVYYLSTTQSTILLYSLTHLPNSF